MTRGKQLRRQYILALATAAAIHAPASALVINLTYSSSVTSLIQASKFENAINYAAQQYEEMYTNPITINLTVAATNAPTQTFLGMSSSAQFFTTYSAVRTALTNNATTSDQETNLAFNWPANDPTGTNSEWLINNAEGKAIGLDTPNNPANDGTFTFNLAYPYNLDPYNRGANTGYDLIGTAEHEFSELMGRNASLGAIDTNTQKPEYRPFDLTHYNGIGVRDLTGLKAGDYFSIDGGDTNLKAFNTTPPNDLQDWDNGTVHNGFSDPLDYVPDSFNAASNPGVANTLTPVDVTAMDILGYNHASVALAFKGGFNDFLIGGNWSSSSQSTLNPFHGAEMLINSSSATAYHDFTPGENFVLASNSDMGQTLEVRAGFFEMNDAGSVTGPGFGLLVNQDGVLLVDGSGSLYAQGPVSIGDGVGVTNAEAEFSGTSTTIIGNPAQTVDFYVGNDGLGFVTQTGSANVETPDLYVGFDAGGNGNYLLNNTATLSVSGDEVIGQDGTGLFQQVNGTNTVNGNLILGAGPDGVGDFDLEGGTLKAGFVNVMAGVFSQSGGTLTTGTVQTNQDFGTYDQSNGSLLANVDNFGTYNFTGGLLLGNFTNQNDATFTYSGTGLFIGSFTNEGTMTLDSSFTVPYSMLNEAPLTLPSGITLTVNGSGIDNESPLTLTGGTLAGVGTKTNDSSIIGYGTISGSGELVNNGFIAEVFGSMVFGLSGNPYYNYGTITLESTIGELDISTPNSPISDRLINSGTVNLSDSVIDGAGGFENASGGSIVGPGEFNNLYFVNDAGGTISVPAGTLNIVPTFASAGTIELTDPTAVLSGGTISNTGTIEGVGTVASGISNSGTIQVGDGTLTLSGAVTNSNGGTISVPDGDTLFVTAGLASNGGTIDLEGGTFDNNGNALSNAGEILGFGTYNGSALNNNGHFGNRIIEFSNGATTVNAPVENNGSISITNGSALFNGDVNNGGGIIQPTNATVTIAGALISNQYVSSNSTNIFQGDVTIINSPTATMTGGDSDQFVMSGGTFTNNATFQNTGLLQSSDPIVNNGSFTQIGSLNQSADFTNNAIAIIGGAQTWAAGTNFNNTAGSATFQSDPGSPTSSTLSVNVTGGSVLLASPQHWAALIVSGGGLVDVANNHIIITYSGADPIASIAGYLASGYAGGAWNGIGIDSSAAAANSDYGVGYLDGDDNVPGATITPGEIEIAYALYGDANLDGFVNATDFAIFGANFNKTVTGWDHGDFTYDGFVNGSDFALLGENFGKSASGTAIALPQSDFAALDAFAIANGLALPNVPEPISAGLLIFAASGALFCRRRRTVASNNNFRPLDPSTNES